MLSVLKALHGMECGMRAIASTCAAQLVCEAFAPGHLRRTRADIHATAEQLPAVLHDLPFCAD